MSTVEVGKYYWIRCYRDDAEWRVAKRTVNGVTPVWLHIVEDADVYIEYYYDTEVNIVGPEIIPPQ